MPTQAQRQRDWEFLAELKPGDEAEDKARDRLVLASLRPEGSGSGNSPWSPQGRTGETAAFGQPGGGSNRVQLVAERPAGTTAPVPGQAQRGGGGGTQRPTPPSTQQTPRNPSPAKAPLQPSVQPVGFVGERASAPASPYAGVGRLFQAEQDVLTPAEQRAVNDRRAEGKGKPLSAAQRRTADRAAEKVSAALGQPLAPLELKRRQLFGPGTINPRTLQEANSPQGWGRVESTANEMLLPNGTRREAQSYEVYRDLAARGEVAAPPRFSEQPRYRAAQEQDLQRIRTWVGENLPPMIANAAQVDLAKQPHHPWAGVKRRYLERFALLESPQGAEAIGVKTQFGRQLLKAIAAERRVRMPWLIREARAAGMDLTTNGLALGLGLATGGLAEAYLAGPGLGLARALGPLAKTVPAMVDGAVGGGAQQAGTAYGGGERRPLELAKALGVGATVGGIGGFFFGSLPAKHLTQVERAQAAAALEQETIRLQGIIRSNPGLSRETHHAVQELTQVQGRIAELRDLSQPVKQGGGSPQAPRPAPKPPVKVKLPEGTQRGGVNQPLPGAANPAQPRTEGPPGSGSLPPEARPSRSTPTALAPQPGAVGVSADPAVTRAVSAVQSLVQQGRRSAKEVVDALREQGGERPGKFFDDVLKEYRRQHGPLPHDHLPAPSPELEGRFQQAAQGPEPSYGGKLNVPKNGKALSPEERVVEARSAARVEQDPTEVVRRYRERYGNVLDVDHAREMFPEYSATAAARTQYSNAVSRPARKVVDLVWEQMMKEAREAGKPFRVVFTAGGPGSGKTYATDKALPGLKERVYLVRDSSLEDFADATAKIEEILASGGTPQIVYVHRDLKGAVKGVVDRAVDPESGRIVTMADVGEKHFLSRQNVLALQKRYQKQLSVTFLDNSLPGAPIVPDIPPVDYTTIEEAQQEASHALELEGRRRAGTHEHLPEATYQALGGTERTGTGRVSGLSDRRGDAAGGTGTRGSGPAGGRQPVTRPSGSLEPSPPSPPNPKAGGEDASGTKLLSGAVVLGAGLAAGQRQKASGGNDRGGPLLAKAVGAQGSLKHDRYVDAEGKRRTAKWYVIGATPQGRAERELMAAHLQRRRPETAGRQWFIPGVGSGTLRELVVERGVVPAEVGNVYRQSPEQWRSGGGRSAKVGAR